MAEEVERLLVRVEATQRQFERQLKNMGVATRRTTTGMENRFKRSNHNIGRGFAQMGGRINPVLGGIATKGGAAAAAIALVGVAAINAARNGEKLLLLEKRLEALTGDAEKAAAGVEAVKQVADLTGTSIDTVATAFSRYTLAAQEIGAVTSETEQLTQTVLQLGAIGGGTQQELTAGAIQLSQSLAKGVLNGDELRSVMENIPLVAKAIADGLGVSIGQLKEMGSQGELTSRKVFDALLSKTDETNEKFGKLPITIERASSRMATAWAIFTAEIDKSLGLSRTLAGVINSIANGLNKLSETGDAAAITARRETVDSLSRQIERLRSEAASADTSSSANPLNLFLGGRGDNIRAQIATLEEKRKNTLAQIDEIEGRIQEKKDNQLDREKTIATNKLREKADVETIAAIQAERDKQELLKLDDKIRKIKEYGDAQVAAFKAKAPGVSEGQIADVRTAAEAFKAAEIAKSEGGSTSTVKTSSKYDDFFQSAAAQKQALEDEIALIGLSGAAYAELAAKQDLLNEAKKRGLDLDSVSAETGKTLREEIDAQSATIGRLTEEYDRLAAKQEFFAGIGQTLRDGFIDAIVDGQSLIGVLEDLARSLAKAYLQAALFNQGPLALGGASGGLLGGLGKILPGFAVGGYTGSGGVNEPKGIVHGGEYVFSKDAVRKIGVNQLDAMHKNLRGYASGGFVGNAPSGTAASDVKLTVNNILDPAIVGDFLSTPAGEKVILNVINRNRGSINA